MKFLKLTIVFISVFVLCTNNGFCFVQKIDGIEYVLRLIGDAPLDKKISSRYDLYEIYFENRSEKTFSIPGYSVDLGVGYTTLEQINSQGKDNNAKKLTVFHLAAGAAGLAFGGIAKSVATTASRSINNIKKRNKNLSGDEMFLSSNKTYILYPQGSLSVFLFVDKFIGESPSSIKFICHDEDNNINHIVINDHPDLREINAGNPENKNEIIEKNDNGSEIASPDSQPYK